MEHIEEEFLIEYLDSGVITPEHKAHLAECTICQKQLADLREVIDTMDGMGDVPVPDAVQFQISTAIAEEIARENQSSGFHWWQVAAAVALLMVGFAVGKLSVKDQTAEIIALQSQVDILKEVSMVNALQTSSASERLQVVNRIESEKPASSQKLLNSLFQTLNTDESPNVRYAAAQALVRFMNEEAVRVRVAESLELQSDPLIQISLISILTEAQEKHAIKPLRKILGQETINPEVKKQAQIALDILI